MGALRLGIIYIDGEPAAAQLWIVHNGCALIYKLAYDERFADLSVGTILSAALFQHALDVDKVAVVDYLSGDDAYKKDWMSARRERWGILALNPRSLHGALAIARHIGGRAVKRVALLLSNRFRRPK
jgi:CelD/BcsL family acetyltransferase involved in cellulose biosynthesis